MTGIADQVSNLEMQVDYRLLDNSLIEALDLYHEWVEKKIVIPRENQLNTSGQAPKPVLLNTPSYSYNSGINSVSKGVFKPHLI